MNFSTATRKLLFRAEDETTIPGAGQSAAKVPKKHTRVKVTINLDGDVVDYFKNQAKECGLGYQVLINQALREYAIGRNPERLAQEVGEILLASESFLESLSESLHPVQEKRA